MRDLYRFCISSLLFLALFIFLYFAKVIKEVRDGYYKYTVPGREIYNAINKSNKKTNKKKLIIGDSTGNQFYNNYEEEDSIYSIACNQAIGMCGHFFLLDDFLKKGNRPKKVYMIFNIFTLSNNLDQEYTYHYFLKPFFNEKYKERMSNNVILQIEKIPHYRLSQFPTIIKSTWAPTYKPHKQYQLMSPISNEYFLKMDSLQSLYDFELFLVPSLIPQNKKQKIEENYENYMWEIDTRLQQCIQKYIGCITYVDDSCFRDGTHLKHPLLYKHIIEEKMKDSNLLFRTK